MESDNTNNTTSSSEEIAAKTGGRQMGPMAENSNGSDQRQMTPPDMNCNTDSGETCEAPEVPEDFDGEMPSDMPSEMQGGMGGGFRGNEFVARDASSVNSWHPAAYLAMGGGSVILGILISYACFSKFFHAKPGQTFSTAGKFVGFIAVALIIAAGLCVLGYFIPVWVNG